jgi:hypothetical protein
VSTLAWIVVSGTLMTALALVGSLTLMVPERTFKKLVMPMVSLAAGSLLGGALFHMLPESVDEIGNTLAIYVWLAAGIFSFFVLEQYLHWHHCHRPVAAHRPLGHLILVADGLHNLIGGLAVGSAFVVDTTRPSTIASARWTRNSAVAKSISHPAKSEYLRTTTASRNENTQVERELRVQRGRSVQQLPQLVDRGRQHLLLGRFRHGGIDRDVPCDKSPPTGLVESLAHHRVAEPNGPRRQRLPVLRSL